MASLAKLVIIERGANEEPHRQTRLGHDQEAAKSTHVNAGRGSGTADAP